MRPARLAFAACCLFLSSAPLLADEPSGPLAEKLKGVTFTQYAKAPGYSEGPTWRTGELFFCSGALYRVDEKKAVHKYLELNPAGTVLKGDGHLLVVDNKHKAVLDVSPDGKRFLMLKDSAAGDPNARPPSMVLVEHWFEELKQRVNGK